MDGHGLLAQRPRAHRSTTVGHRIELLLVDDHRAVVDALASALEREPDMIVVGTAGSIREVTERALPRPDVAIVDFGLPDGTGADACRLIKARWPDTRIVMLSASATDEEILAMIRAGADGYVTKAQRLTALVRVLRDTYAGRPTVAPDMLGRIARGLRAGPAASSLAAPLTARELTVLRALAAGHSTHSIAAELAIADGTVLRHVEAIRRKFGVRTRLEAVTKAIQLHIVRTPAL
jgi:DNA-binding NarL/FixJ family response regulator